MILAIHVLYVDYKQLSGLPVAPFCRSWKTSCAPHQDVVCLVLGKQAQAHGEGTGSEYKAV